MIERTLHESGYHNCECRDCFEIAIGQGAMCSNCEEAGCVPDSECQHLDAYGGCDDPAAR